MTGLLEGKRILVTGIITDSSIAFHIAKAAQEAGAELVLTGFDRMKLIQRIAEICEHKLVDQPSAFLWWCRAIREAPLSELAGEEVERLADLGVRLIGIDSASVDPADSVLLESHQALRRHGLRVLENLCLDAVDAVKAGAAALPC